MTNLLGKVKKIKIRRHLYRNLPESPGVYIFFRQSVPIYIGKAINLKRRISSYFDLDLEPKTRSMINNAESLAYIRVTSELEALLLEARLIRKFMPHFNIAAKDDKHPLYIRITKEKYPRVLTARRIENDPTSLKLREARKNIAFFGPFPSSANVRTVLRIIRRIFPYSDHKLGKRACLYSHIGLCVPCPNTIEITKDKLQKTNLRNDYLRNISYIKSILSGKFVSLKNNLKKEMEDLSVKEMFEDAAEIRNKIASLEYITRPQIPTEFYMQNPNFYEDIRLKELGQLQKLVGATNGLERIECYDISHLSGKNPTASMVALTKGEIDKNYYRHFKIHHKRGEDDYESMREVARRRLNHLKDWGTPDLIIVDGSTGQVNAFLSVLNKNKINIPVVGIAKNPDRLILGVEKVRLIGSPLNLVQRIRDEAHRFARRYHHKLVEKAIMN